MCGIVGYATKGEVTETILTSMREELIHRGPDGFGNYISSDKNVGLAHRRLAIVDLSSNGAQPMVTNNKDYAITYNGEVYNYIEIKDELEGLGYRFKSTSDTEVILNAYIEWGEECLDKFNGMFAFVIYDKPKNKLFLARDRFGIKPLYYAILNNGDFVFTSEIKAIIKHPNFAKKLNFTAIKDYFKYRYIPAPKTIWHNVFKLEHSFCAFYDLNTSELIKIKYYDLYHILTKNESSIQDVEKCLKNAINIRLRADVEIGAFLSGGLDSSTIAAISKQNISKIKTFSIGFEPEKYSELKYSKEVAKYLDVELISQVIDNIDDTILDQLAYYYDEPLADSSCVPTYILSKMTAKHLKVVLSGDGGDEVFSGYNWYITYNKDFMKYSKSIKNKLYQFLGLLPRNHVGDFEKYYNKLLLDRFDDNIFEKMFCPDIFNKIQEGESFIMEKYLKNDFKSVRSVQYIDLNTFMVDDILTKVDRATMAFSLESRVPFLDHNLVQAVLCLPESDFPSNSIGKPVLCNIMNNELPESVFERRKQGFSAPVPEWDFYKTSIKGLSSGLLVNEGYINKQFILDLEIGKYKNSPAILWMILVFERWCKVWLK